VQSPGSGTIFVQRYLTKKQLAKLGYRFNPSKLSDYEVEAYMIVANELAKCENEDMKKASRKKSRKR